jgi:hypothetical protein
MTVAELLARMSGEELTDWQAYERAHGPLGPARADWHAALITSMLVNVNRGKKGKPAQPKDFLLAFKSASEASDPEELERVGRMLASQLGGEWTDAPAEGGEADG